MIKGYFIIAGGKVYVKQNGEIFKIGNNCQIKEKAHKEGGYGFFNWKDLEIKKDKNLIKMFPELAKLPDSE